MFHSYVSTETIARRFIWQQLEQAVEKTKLASQSHSSAWGILYQWCEGQWKSLCCLLSSRECSARPLVLGMGRSACLVSTLDSSESIAGEEFLSLFAAFLVQ